MVVFQHASYAWGHIQLLTGSMLIAMEVEIYQHACQWLQHQWIVIGIIKCYFFATATAYAVFSLRLYGGSMFCTSTHAL